MPGHVFVVRADLTRLACDALMPSCDAWLNIADTWADVLPSDLPRGDADTWLRLPHELSDGCVVRLPRSDEGPWVVPIIAVGRRGTDTPLAVATAIANGVRQLSPELSPGNGRALPLVAVHLAGSGDGGLGGHRGELIKLLLPVLRSVAGECDVDIALAFRDARDVAAAQVQRDDEDWGELTPELVDIADALGRRAADGELSIFVGAGVSQPVGLPSWTALVQRIADDAGVDLTSRAGDEIDQASRLERILGRDVVYQAVREQLTTKRHALGHALLANLQVRQSVTTNFDRCLELALDAVHGKNGYRVLTKSLAEGGKPWLLKLHGDIKNRESLVFTREDYDGHKVEHEAVRGVVQSLMLTSHLLFVGFGMADRNFLELAEAVTKVRRQADSRTTTSAGTALALTETPVRHVLRRDLEFHAMREDATLSEAARVLEILLDRLAWQAATGHDLSAAYLLDERYSSGLSADDEALRDAVVGFVGSLPPGATDSTAWPRVQRLLTDLGHVDPSVVGDDASSRPASRSPRAEASPDGLHDFRDFRRALQHWLESTDDATVAGARLGHRKDHTVTIQGVPCSLDGGTTRAGVQRFLELTERGEPAAVVLDRHGRQVKIVVGEPPQRIKGFYLYALTPVWEPRVLGTPSRRVSLDEGPSER